jgi:phosphoenolpyruvate carboxylase
MKLTSAPLLEHHSKPGSRRDPTRHVLACAKQVGISRSRLETFLATAQAAPVLTALPTEMRRKCTIDRVMEVAELLAEWA